MIRHTAAATTAVTKAEQPSQPAQVAKPSKPATVKKPRRSWNHIISLIGLSIAQICQLGVLFLLILLSAADTWVFVRQATADEPATDIGRFHVIEALERHSHQLTPLFVLFLIMVLMFLVAVAHIADIRHPSHTVLAICVFACSFFLAAGWVVARHMFAYSFPDTESLSQGAIDLITGHANHFDAAWCEAHAHECTEMPPMYRYFVWYPYQAGSLLWFVLIFKIFVTGNIFAIQFVNALLGAGVCVVLWKLGEALHLSDGGLTVLALLLIGCLPWEMHSMYAYTDIPGFFFALLSLWITYKAVTAHRSWWATLLLGIVSFAIAGLGLTFKSTFIILLLAQIAALIVVAFATRRWWLAIFAPIIGYAANKIPDMAIRRVEHITGQQFGKGLPKLDWIDIGLNDALAGPPGWWSRRALHREHVTRGDYDAHLRLVKRALNERIAFFKHNPDVCYRFFHDKISSEWADPTFESMYHSETGDSPIKDGISRAVLTGRLHTLIFTYENVMQTFVYVLAAVGVICALVAQFRRLHRDVQNKTLFVECALSAAFVGGFICYVFWEAKSAYTLPFFVLLIPFAARGIQATHTGVSTLIASTKSALHRH